MFKAFGYKFFDQGFNVSIDEEVITSSRFLKVDIKKIEQYTVPIAILETISDDGNLSRMMSYFKNCDTQTNHNLKGRLCPDWKQNGMREKLRIQGSYLDDTKRTSIKFSFIKCVNTTRNGDHCKS